MKLTLFVGNTSVAAASAIAALKDLVADHPERFCLEIIDVNEQPERAEHHRIIATPTLIRELPPPVRRLVGDLSRHREVRIALDLAAEQHNRGNSPPVDRHPASPDAAAGGNADAPDP